MPFTFSHPAAVLPLVRILGRYGILSALVIGSIAPDLPYIIPIDVHRYESHSLAGLFWFCIPAGLILYIAYHLFLKGPLLSLAPEFISEKLDIHVIRFQSIPSASLPSIILCLLIGAITHVVWDSFTHYNGLAVESFSILKTPIFSVGEYSVDAYKILQHCSTVVGLLALAWVAYTWFKCAPINRVILPCTLSPAQRFVILFGIVVIPSAIGLWTGLNDIGEGNWLFEFQAFAGRAIFAALPTFALMLVLYSLWWHSNRWYWRANKTR